MSAKTYPITDMDRLIFKHSNFKLRMEPYVYRGVIRTDYSYTFIYILSDGYMHFITYKRGIENSSHWASFVAKYIHNDKGLSIDNDLVVKIAKQLSKPLIMCKLALSNECIPDMLIFDIITYDMIVIDDVDDGVTHICHNAKEIPLDDFVSDMKFMYTNIVDAAKSSTQPL